MNKAVAGLILLTIGFTAVAEPLPYVGVSAGTTHYSTWPFTHSQNASASSATVTGGMEVASSMEGKLKSALEVSYMSAGGIGFDVPNTLSVRADVLSASYRAAWVLNEISLTGRVGVSHASGHSGIPQLISTTSHTGISEGLGARYRFAPHWSVTLDADRALVRYGDITDKFGLVTYSAGVLYHF